MIAEWLMSLRITCAPHIRHMGYHKQLVAIAYRFDRQRNHWHTHLQKTRDVIEAAMEKCPEKNVIVILGAGILLDIPLEEICRQFKKVYLVDVVFLPRTRKSARQYSNCQLIACDITGTAHALHQIVTAQKDDNRILPVLPEPEGPTELSAIKPDLTLSTNIMSQLPVLPREYLEHHFAGQLDDFGTEIDAFCQNLITHHLKWLKSLPGLVCLISDVKHIYYRSDTDQNEIIEEEDPLHGIHLPDNDDQWIWDVAPPGELSNNIGIRNLVQATYGFNS